MMLDERPALPIFAIRTLSVCETFPLFVRNIRVAAAQSAVTGQTPIKQKAVRRQQRGRSLGTSCSIDHATQAPTAVALCWQVLVETDERTTTEVVTWEFSHWYGKGNHCSVACSALDFSTG